MQLEPKTQELPGIRGVSCGGLVCVFVSLGRRMGSQEFRCFSRASFHGESSGKKIGNPRDSQSRMVFGRGGVRHSAVAHMAVEQVHVSGEELGVVRRSWNCRSFAHALLDGPGATKGATSLGECATTRFMKDMLSWGTCTLRAGPSRRLRRS